MSCSTLANGRVEIRHYWLDYHQPIRSDIVSISIAVDKPCSGKINPMNYRDFLGLPVCSENGRRKQTNKKDRFTGCMYLLIQAGQ